MACCHTCLPGRIALPLEGRFRRDAAGVGLAWVRYGPSQLRDSAGIAPASLPDAPATIARRRDRVVFLGMGDLSFDYLDAIASHSAGFAAAAAAAGLDAPVPGCPGWTVADLVDHMTEVHWFWATIVADRLAEPPPEDRRPARADAERLIPAFEAGAARLVSVLRASGDAEPVWTWAPLQQDVGFVRRHQVQEAAVHHWDAEQAAG